MKNKFNTKSVSVLAITIIILIAISYVPEGLTLFGINLKKVDVLSDLKTENEEEEYYFEEYYEDDDSVDVADSSSYPEEEVFFDNKDDKYINKASVKFLENIISLTNRFVDGEIGKLKNVSRFSIKELVRENISGNVKQLDSFFNALKKSGSRKVRIAHYGDSGIEGDLISADLREILQSKFGGEGVGFLPMVPEGLNYRQSITFSHSDNWKMYGINVRNRDRLPVGINGEVYLNEGSAWIEYKTINRFRHSKSFQEVKLFYSNAESSSVKYSINGKSDKTGRLFSGSRVKVLDLEASNGRSIKIEFPKSKQGYFYGLSLEGGPGIYLDNFAFRGNSGVDLKKIPVENLKEFDALLNYDLIIFQFGLNALSNRQHHYKKYEKDMIKVVEHFKKAFPTASFIMIGAQDKSIKRGSEFKTDPSLIKLIQAQINVAKETKIAFWNLFEAMGGQNSMIRWVNSSPSLAYKDYIHFNESGVKEVARMFSAALLKLNN